MSAKPKSRDVAYLRLVSRRPDGSETRDAIAEAIRTAERELGADDAWHITEPLMAALLRAMGVER